MDLDEVGGRSRVLMAKDVHILEGKAAIFSTSKNLR